MEKSNSFLDFSKYCGKVWENPDAFPGFFHAFPRYGISMKHATILSILKRAFPWPGWGRENFHNEICPLAINGGLSVYHVYLYTCIPVYLCTCVPVYLCTCVPVCLCACVPVCLCLLFFNVICQITPKHIITITHSRCHIAA